MEEENQSPEQNKSKEAESVVRNHLVWAMGAGFIPVPVADFFAVSAIQLDMVRQLCRVYHVDFKETEGKAIITSITSSGLARLTARVALKFIPGAGSFIGGMAVSVLSGASTYGLGQTFIKHFETGGTFLDFDVNRLKKVYDDMFEKGKKVAENIREEEKIQDDALKNASHNTTAAVIDKLTELAKLKDQGLITEDEFIKMKERLLAKI